MIPDNGYLNWSTTIPPLLTPGGWPVAPCITTCWKWTDWTKGGRVVCLLAMKRKQVSCPWMRLGKRMVLLYGPTQKQILTTQIHGGDTDSSLSSTIDSSILSDDVDNIVPSRSTTTAVCIVRKIRSNHHDFLGTTEEIILTY
jgi:hypothetical protein